MISAYYLDESACGIKRVHLSNHRFMWQAIDAIKAHAARHKYYRGILDEELDSDAYGEYGYDMAAQLGSSIRIYGAEPA